MARKFLTLTELIDQLVQARARIDNGSDLVAVEVPFSDYHYIEAVQIGLNERVYIVAKEVDRT